jgi:endonuclease/exonuclease/phosphatase family metal-dependent hydrolase
VSELIIASYNIHRCIGVDGQYQPARIRHILHEIDAHFFALQEVECGERHGELLEYLTDERRHWSYIEGPALLRGEARYGNAVLTSLPVIKQRLIDLGYALREPRGAIDVYVQCRDKVIRLLATHLGLSPRERRYQLRLLLKLLSSQDEPAADMTVLVGDLNEWLPWARPLRWLRRSFGNTVYLPTYSTRWPLLPLDQFYIKPHSALLDIRTYRTALTRYASDHYPLVATIKTDARS